MKKLIYLLLILGLLQLAVSLFTYGFTLYDDEAIWHYIGRNWLRWGIPPYQGGFDNKTPLIFLIYGISDLLFGVNYWFPRVIGTVVETVGVWYVFKIAMYLAGRRAGIMAMTMYGLALLWRSTEGRYPSLTETYEVTLINIAVYLSLVSKGSRDHFRIGLVAGLGVAFRLTGLAGAVAIFLFSGRRRKAFNFAAGVTTCVVVLLAAAALSGVRLKDLWQYAFLNNFHGSGQPFDWRLYLTRLTKGFFHNELLFFYPLTLTYFITKRKADILLTWLTGSCCCILMLGAFSEAYFKDILPPLAIASAACIDIFGKAINLSFRKALAVIWICFFPKDTEPLFSALDRNHPGAGTGTPESYCIAPYPPLTNFARKRLGLWIKANTQPNEKVYVPTPTVLVYTERQCPIISFSAGEWESARNTFYRQMNANKPDLLALPLNSGYEANVSAEQRNFIHSLAASPAYRADTCIYGYTIYHFVQPVTDTSRHWRFPAPNSPTN